jgi:hypothetical protein
VIEVCPVCDSLWRLYAKGAENLHDLVGKHTDARGKGDGNSVAILAHEVTIAESTLRAVRREIRLHESARHSKRENRKPENQKPEAK